MLCIPLVIKDNLTDKKVHSVTAQFINNINILLNITRPKDVIGSQQQQQQQHLFKYHNENNNILEWLQDYLVSNIILFPGQVMNQKISTCIL